MTRLPELSYALSEARSTPLLAEFSAILNLAETFGPLLPLDPAVTFYAPLRSSLSDLRGAPASFQRASEALYLRDNLWRIAGAGNPRFGDFGLLMEPAVTNKQTTYNAQPDAALTNYSLVDNGSGAILQRVDDEAALAAAGLSGVTGAYAVELDNRANSSWAVARCAGNVGNINTHTFSGFLRVLNGPPSNAWVQNSAGTIIAPATGATYQRVFASGIPTGVGNTIDVRCQAGSRARFTLLQLEESPVITSPIITRGAAASREDDTLEYDRNGSVDVNQGMALADLVWPFDAIDVPTNSRNGVISLRDTSLFSILSSNHNNGGLGTTQAVLTHEGATPSKASPNLYLAGEPIRVACYWGDPSNNCNVAISQSGSALEFGTAQLFEGFIDNGALGIGRQVSIPVYIKEVMIWNSVLSEEDMISRFSP